MFPFDFDLPFPFRAGGVLQDTSETGPRGSLCCGSYPHSPGVPQKRPKSEYCYFIFYFSTLHLLYWYLVNQKAFCLIITEIKIFSSLLKKLALDLQIISKQTSCGIDWLMLYVPEQVRPSWAWERTWPRPSGVWRRLTPLWLSRLVANCSSVSSASHRWSTLWVERGPSPILLTVMPRLLLNTPSPL